MLSLHRNNNRNNIMNSFLLFITTIVLAAADQPMDSWGHQTAYEPATIISQGPWVEEAMWDNRDPKGMMEDVPTPTSVFSKFSSWWSWDR